MIISEEKKLLYVANLAQVYSILKDDSQLKCLLFYA